MLMLGYDCMYNTYNKTYSFPMLHLKFHRTADVFIRTVVTW